eukprot:CAMPEP_0181290960 /NCGR_PEP_ID=MMETSP1101-20121128/1701_1 /TAXON_ID=46948 /ORGANISM="Rhodomonas abbreviata, Strain Caron Lab Isolate" /LENGTH=142 /DNA_ID=CAMNT_0023395297 /DNA_START=339 /DNA_END=764 /DNA_ORIENTATION=+
MLNIILLLQCAIFATGGFLLTAFPDIVRDFICDKTVSKCERLSGCGLSIALSNMVGLGMLGWSYLAFVTRGFKDIEARKAVVRGFVLIEGGGALLVGKEIGSQLLRPTAWPVAALLAALAAAHGWLLTRGDIEHRELRARAE